MERVKFTMQDTLRYLVQDSLANFVQSAQDGAASVMRLDEGFEWDGDLLTSRFRPKRNPLFLIDLQLDAQGSHYSTPLTNFDTALVNLFNKAIQNTQSVPQLEKVLHTAQYEYEYVLTCTELYSIASAAAAAVGLFFNREYLYICILALILFLLKNIYCGAILFG